MRTATAILLAVFLAGCSGEYILTVPDVVCPAGAQAELVFKLQRREFWRITPPQKDAAVIVQLPSGDSRCIRTDRNGYAAVAFVVPFKPGVYGVELYYQDDEGRSISAEGSVYSLLPDKPVVLVDLDCLPRGGRDLKSARAAIERLGQAVQLVYFSERVGSSCTVARRLLRMRGYPVGPVVFFKKYPRWYRRYRFDPGWHAKWFKPRSTDSNIVSLRRRLKKLDWAITTDLSAAEALIQAGLKVVIIGKGKRMITEARRVNSWDDLDISTLEVKNASITRGSSR